MRQKGKSSFFNIQLDETEDGYSKIHRLCSQYDNLQLHKTNQAVLGDRHIKRCFFYVLAGEIRFSQPHFEKAGTSAIALAPA